MRGDATNVSGMTISRSTEKITREGAVDAEEEEEETDCEVGMLLLVVLVVLFPEPSLTPAARCCCCVVAVSGCECDATMRTFNTTLAVPRARRALRTADEGGTRA